jgi:hypothetical protein
VRTPKHTRSGNPRKTWKSPFLAAFFIDPN